MLTGMSAPPPFFLNISEAGCSKSDFHQESTIWDIDAFVKTLPWNSNFWPSGVYPSR